MSKSLGNAIGIQEPASEIYGKLMSIPDRLLWSYLELLTDLPTSEIASRRQGVESGATNPRDVKAELARTITAQFHGKDAAARAEEDFNRAFSKGELPEAIEKCEVPPDSPEWGAARLLVAVGLSSSGREARRKIAEGALCAYRGPHFETIRDPNEKILASGDVVIRLGRRFLHVVTKPIGKP